MNSRGPGRAIRRRLLMLERQRSGVSKDEENL
jgi:hypothetical protein